MKLGPDEARARLAAHVHGVCCTVHPERGPDPTPVVYALDDDGFVGIPIDSVKPKASSRLQRERNLEADPRAALLVEHWNSADWTRLWWVRADGEASGELSALTAGLSAQPGADAACGVQGVQLPAVQVEQPRQGGGPQPFDAGQDRPEPVERDTGRQLDRLFDQQINVSVTTPNHTRIDSEDRQLPAMVRASVHYYNSEDETEHFGEAIERLAKR